MLSTSRTKLGTIRTTLGIVLIAAAPFTFVPSYSLPFEGLVSFRLGLYQSLLVLFVLSVMPLIWQRRKQLLHDYAFSVPLCVLMVLIIISPFRSLLVSRSILMSGSIIVLLLALLGGYAISKDLYKKTNQKNLVRAVMGVGIFVAFFCILQFIANTYASTSLGLCAKCSADVFGFPRVNGFSAEPQFLASALLLPILLSYYFVLKSKNFVRPLCIFGLFIFVLGLSLSRGGVVATAVGIFALTAYFYDQKQLPKRRVLYGLLVLFGAGVLSIGALMWSATARHPETNKITSATFATIVEHMSGGAVQLSYNDPPPPEPIQTNVVELPMEPMLDSPTPKNEDPTPSIVETPSTFESPGEISASQGDRESAVATGLRFWGKDSGTLLFGLGSGNLGSYAAANDSLLTLSFTIYMQYALILVELGLMGLISFMGLLALGITRAFRAKPNGAFGVVVGSLLVAYTVHFIFFGTYINTPYVWLIIGVGLGQKTAKRIHMKG